MPEHLRSLVIILAFAAIVFAFAKAPACALACSTADFERRRNLWFAITLTAFLAHNFWIYIIVSAVLLLFVAPREPNKLAMYFLVLFAVPAVSAPISGMGVVQHLFTIHYLRLLALAVLLPAFLFLRRQPNVEPFGRLIPDKLIAGYLILNLLLQLQFDTITNTLRIGVFYAFIDVFLPYYVASRALKNLANFRDALMAFAVAALVLSAVAAFEFAKHWLLYTALEDALGVPWGTSIYLRREGSLRAQGSTGQPIPLGYVMAVAMGFFLYLRKSVPSPTVWMVGLAALIVGLIVPLSRGPWVGAAAMVLVFLATGPNAIRRFATLGALGAIALPLVLVSPAGPAIIDHLPFVGTIQAENITYRERLLEISVQIILQNPFFGTVDAKQLSEMQELRQGQGIIDVVNTYVGIALGSGLVGLSLFAGFFVSVAVGIFKGMTNLTDRHGEPYLLGQVLLSTLLGILLIIFTVSSISVIPVVYWSVAGLGVAYARMLALAKAPETARPAGYRAAATRIGA